MSAKQIEQTKQAVANLRAAIDILTRDGATEADIEPYRVNLSEQEARLRKLEGG